MFVACLKHESLDIGASVVIGIVEDCRPNLLRFEFLNTNEVGFVVVVGIKVGDIEFSVGEYNEDAVIVLEFTEISAVIIIVDSLHIGIVPNLASTEGTASVALQLDAEHIVLGKDITHCRTSLDGNLAEVLRKLQFLELLVWLEHHTDDFRLTVGVSSEIGDA